MLLQQLVDVTHDLQLTVKQNGDAVTDSIKWTVDALEIDEPGDTLDGVLWFSRDQEVTATVVTSDGAMLSEPTSISLTVANTAPTAPEINVSPEAPVPGEDDIVCSVSVEATDDDDDDIYSDLSTQELVQRSMAAMKAIVDQKMQ